MFKKREGFSCVYNKRTGWFFPRDEAHWRFLKSFQHGRDIRASDGKSILRFDLLLQALMDHKFLLREPDKGIKKYLDFFPTQTLFTVYYQCGSRTDVAVHRDGPHGEIDFEVLTFEGTTNALWGLCKGRSTIRQLVERIAEEQGEDQETVMAQVFDILEKWTSLDFQIAKLLPKSIHTYQVIPPQLLSPAPFVPKLKTPAPKRVEDTHGYHISGIGEGYRQFERIESTLSHIYRVPHPVLRGKSYGEAFLSSLWELKPLVEGCRILEIGGGHGDISRDLLKTLQKTKPNVFSTLTYVIYDLSPELIKTQRKLHEEAGVQVKHIHGDAEHLTVSDESFDIILSNEVIADFSTPEFSLKDVERSLEVFGIPVSEEFLRGLKDAPDRFRLNLGAFRLLKEVGRVLKPGGIAIITEYGYVDQLPTRAQHLDHDEYTIHFGHLVSLAKALGLKARLTDAYEFLKFRSNLELITHASYEAAFRLLERDGTHLPNIVYTRELLREQLGKKADFLRNIRFIKVTDEPMDRAPIEIVKVLICEKPFG